jgi:hypothetical protein
MFSTGDTVLCVDDTFPNPNCSFPNGYVVRGQRYEVVGVTLWGAVRIAGLPVLPTHVPNLMMFGSFNDAGWKPHRFRKIADDPLMDSESQQDLELVGASR